jgi:hypothetical protein
MQPYIFPYIGYYQLINAVDKFVIYDDVNYINRGWINRNNILVNGKGYLFTIPLQDASQNRLINEIEIAVDEAWKKKFLRTVEQSYKKAPYYNDVCPIITATVYSTATHVCEFSSLSLRAVMEYLEIPVEFVSSSSIYNNRELKGQDRILDICMKENSDHYINPIGGMEIYSEELFQKAGIKLNFIQCKPITYRQFNNEFVSHLSIIDVLMFNDKEAVTDMLQSYELI